MQEYHITVAGQRYDLTKPFHVLATQNPLEQEGTYPLPEAQLDRFLLQVDVDYPELSAERQILLDTTGTASAEERRMIDPQRMIAIQTLIHQMLVNDKVVDAILALVRSAHPDQGNKLTDQNVARGPGPRDGQSLMLTARARALYEGRLAPSPDDAYALAEAVLEHRMALTFAARADSMSVRDLIAGLVEQVKN